MSDNKLIEKTLESRRIFEGKLINVRVDTVRLPDGGTSTREIVEHNGGVAIVPVLDHETVMMVRQFRQPTGQVLLEVPAGTLKPGEDPMECAQRELVEEIGYSAGKITPMFSSYLAPGYSSEKLHTFLAEELHQESQNTDSDEFIEVVSVRLDDAVEMIRTGEIADAKSICGILLASRLFKGCCG
ncbi:MAG: NUDIX domain-containing protein [Armatimonadota bacterium]